MCRGRGGALEAGANVWADPDVGVEIEAVGTIQQAIEGRGA